MAQVAEVYGDARLSGVNEGAGKCYKKNPITAYAPFTFNIRIPIPGVRVKRA